MKRNTKLALGAGAALLAVGGAAYALSSKSAAPQVGGPAPAGGSPTPTPGPHGQVAPPGGFITPGGIPSIPSINPVIVNNPNVVQNPNAGNPLIPPPVAVTLDNGQLYAFSVATALTSIGIVTADSVLTGQLGLAGFSGIDVTACFPSDAGGSICSGFATWSGDQGAAPPSIPGLIWMSLVPSSPTQAGQR